MKKLRKNIIGISAPRSFLAKNFIKNNKKKFKIKKYNHDINNKKSFNSWIDKNNNINYFINFAAYSKNDNREKNIKTNYLGVINMMNIISKKKIKKFKYFLCISSCHVFKKSDNILTEKSEKKPDNFYGLSKLKMENKIIKDYKKFGFKIGICRIFNFYNFINKNYFLNDILKKLKGNNKKISFVGVDTYRDFIDYKDVISAINHMLILNLEKDFNVSTGKKFYLKKIIIDLNNKIKKKKLTFIDTYKKSLIGNSNKLKKTGWKITKNFNYIKLIDN